MNRKETLKLAEHFQEYIRTHHNANSGWWNDNYAFEMMEDVVKPAIAALRASVAPKEGTLPKRPFAFAVRRAPENGADEWQLFRDEGDAREAAAQLDGDYEGLYRVGDRRTALSPDSRKAEPVAWRRDDLMIDPRLTVFAENAAKQIARAERLDNVSAKEAYRTIIEAIISACLAKQAEIAADAALAPATKDNHK